MPDKLKSAYELAMERLRRQDAERGDKPPALGKKQKEEIAEARRFYQAKLAEREILYQSERRKARAAGDPEAAAEALRKVEEAYRLDRDRLERDRESRIEAIRAGADKRNRQPDA